VAGFHTEYSAMKFGMFFLGEYLGVTLIFGHDRDAFLRGVDGTMAPAPGLVALKTFFFIGFLYFWRASLRDPVTTSSWPGLEN